MFFRQIQHLLPNARAWRLTASKRLREFFEGLSSIGSDVRDFADLVWSDMFPDDTRQLTEWELQFGISSDGLTEAARRERLDAAWKAAGGQSPRYLQDTLRAAGFDVYVHEWWDPAAQPPIGIKQCVAARDPNALIVSPLSELAEGYLLVNKLFTSKSVIIPLAGDTDIAAGEPLALAGNYLQYQDIPKDYPVPIETEKHHYFLYVGGETFPDFAYVPADRRDEFEELCLRICPAHLWLGILVSYSLYGVLQSLARCVNLNHFNNTTMELNEIGLDEAYQSALLQSIDACLNSNQFKY